MLNPSAGFSMLKKTQLLLCALYGYFTPITVTRLTLLTHSFIGTNDEAMNAEQTAADYSVLFDAKPTLFGSIPKEGTGMASKGTGMSKSAVYYGLAQAKLLAQVLTRRQLPGLSSMDQLYLLALSDTVASTNMDLEGDDVQERGLSFAKKETNTGEFENLLQCFYT